MSPSQKTLSTSCSSIDCYLSTSTGAQHVHVLCMRSTYPPCCQLLQVREYLFAQLVGHLIEAQVHLGFNFVVEELLLEVMEGIVTTVAVQVQGVQNEPRVRGYRSPWKQ